MKTRIQAFLLCLFAGAFLFSFSETRCAAGNDTSMLIARNDAVPPHAKAPHDKPAVKRDLPPRDDHGRFVSPEKDKHGNPLPPRDKNGRFVSPEKDKHGHPLPPRDEKGRFVSPDKAKQPQAQPPRDEHGRFLPKDKAPQPAPARR